MPPQTSGGKIDELRARLRAEPKSRHFYPLGEELRREGKLAEAEQTLRQGLTNHPAYLSAWISLGRVLKEEEKYGEAVDALNTAFGIDAGNVVTARLLADCHLALGNKVEAIKKYKLVHALLPADEELRAVIERLDHELNAPAGAGPALPAQPEEAVEETLETTEDLPEVTPQEDAAPAVGASVQHGEKEVFGGAPAEEQLSGADVGAFGSANVEAADSLFGRHDAGAVDEPHGFDSARDESVNAHSALSSGSFSEAAEESSPEETPLGDVSAGDVFGSPDTAMPSEASRDDVFATSSSFEEAQSLHDDVMSAPAVETQDEDHALPEGDAFGASDQFAHTEAFAEASSRPVEAGVAAAGPATVSSNTASDFERTRRVIARLQTWATKLKGGESGV